MDPQTAALFLANIVVETVRDTGDQGTPEGPMYAALMGHINYDTFTNLMESLIALGALERRSGHLIFLGPNAEKFLTRI